ncbi:TadE/TadG family type IV pilus assembly protein [Duganella callida]|uniref:Pilus assembly protein n=1 Tax=Duganella callida TaxID=2561932 RepID=A0A4Y9SK63_9BURK|nr:TadE/TadG family type IV pilus assembly protein [Duganella callida]TFW23258.1 pilus assembly protein [Duganella callida]
MIRPRKQGGAALLELALTLPVLLTMLAYLVFYGRLLYTYEIMQKASRDATRYLSTASATNMHSPALVGQEIAVTQAILQSELGTMGAAASGAFVTILCNATLCNGGVLPTTVTVVVELGVQNDLPGYVNDFPAPWLIASQTMRYAGN